MGIGIVVAAITGLAVGIAFVLLFAFYSSASQDIVTGTTKSGGINISLSAMKNQYSTIEPLNFTVTGKGHGLICGFDPTAKILDAQSGKLVYDVPTLDLTYECLDQPVDVNITITLYDFMYPRAPVLIGETGYYRLVVEVEGVVLQKDFVVYELPMQEDLLITKTKGIEETKFFLSRYPDAEVEVQRYPEDYAEVVYRVERPVNPPEELKHWPKTHSLSLWFEMTDSTGEIRYMYAECGTVHSTRTTADIIESIATTDCLNPNWDNVDYGQNEN